MPNREYLTRTTRNIIDSMAENIMNSSFQIRGINMTDEPCAPRIGSESCSTVTAETIDPSNKANLIIGCYGCSFNCRICNGEVGRRDSSVVLTPSLLDLNNDLSISRSDFERSIVGPRICIKCAKQIVDGEHFHRCHGCGLWSFEPHGKYLEGSNTRNSVWVCNSCLECSKFTCSHCNRTLYSITTMSWRLFNNNTVCDRCKKLHYFICSDCHNGFPNNEALIDPVTGEHLCGSCYPSRFVVCTLCGRSAHIRTTMSLGDRLLCRDCVNSSRGYEVEPVKPYNYKPSIFNFYTYTSKDVKNNDVTGYDLFNISNEEDSKKLYLGIEVEIDGFNSTSAKERCALDILKQFSNKEKIFYIKHDGSLRCGFEIVTHPMELQALFLIPWNEIFNIAKSYGAYAFKEKTCGLHVHFNKSYYGCNLSKPRTSSYNKPFMEKALRLLDFINKNFMELSKISRRCNNNYRCMLKESDLPIEIDQGYTHCIKNCGKPCSFRYCRKQHTVKNLMKRIKKYGGRRLYNVADLYNGSIIDKYSACNLTNFSTIEIRLWRGTLNVESFKSLILLTYLIIQHVHDTNKSKSIKIIDIVAQSKQLQDDQKTKLIGFIAKRISSNSIAGEV
ncbi:amidoligase family protein [bacterium]|nr:amidoligase family protein [bacterium]